MPDDTITVALTLGRATIAYIVERRDRGQLSDNSIKSYRSILWIFAKAAGTDLPVARLSPRHIEKWYDGYSDRSLATRRHRLSVVRTFCRWLVRRNHLRRDPSLDIDGPRQPHYKYRGIARGDADWIVDAAPDRRMLLMVLLMLQEGLRCCEVAALEVGDIDWTERELLVHGKGDKERGVPISQQTWLALSSYLADHPVHAGAVLRSTVDPNRPLTAGYVSRLVNRYVRSLGMSWTAHQLRHTALGDMLRQGAHVRDVQTVAGHESIGTTQLYLPHIVRGLREAMGGRQYGSGVVRNLDAGSRAGQRSLWSVP